MRYPPGGHTISAPLGTDAITVRTAAETSIKNVPAATSAFCAADMNCVTLIRSRISSCTERATAPAPEGRKVTLAAPPVGTWRPKALLAENGVVPPVPPSSTGRGVQVVVNLRFPWIYV